MTATPPRCTLLLAIVLAATPAWAGPPYAGRSLYQVLLELQQEGLPLVFSSAVVGTDLEVRSEPSASEPRELLSELLSAYGLEVKEAAGRWVVVATKRPPRTALLGEVRSEFTGRPLAGARIEIVGTRRAVISDRSGRFALRRLAPGSYPLLVTAPLHQPLERTLEVDASREIHVELTLPGRTVASEEIVVSSAVAPTSPLAPVSGEPLPRQVLNRLPDVAGDPLRRSGHLAGIQQQFSARPRVRGGTSDEIGIQLDGVELYEPYHLQDFGGLLSVVPSAVLEQVELDSVGLDARYGDRMSGVLDLSTLRPRWALRGELELGLLASGASASGQARNGDVRWVGSGRLGTVQAVTAALEAAPRPSFADSYGKLAFGLVPSQQLAASALFAEDRLRLQEGGESRRRDYDTRYWSGYLWLSHQAGVGKRAFVETLLAVSEARRARNGLEEEAGRASVALEDDRHLETLSARFDASFAVGRDHHLEWGGELRLFDSDIDYFNRIALDDPLAVVRSNPTHLSTRYDAALNSRQKAVYAQERWRPTAHLSLLLGLRFERGTLWNRSRLNPRIRVTHQSSDRLRWSLSWGEYSQSERPYELPVEDGDDDLALVQHADELTFGFEYRLGDGWWLRGEAFERLVDDPQPRWANLFEPLALALEGGGDRVRIEPTSSQAQGLALSLSRRFGPRWEAMLSASTLEAEERLVTGEIRRDSDVPLDLRLRIFCRLSERWRLATAARSRSGWPITPLRLGPSTSPQPVLELGELYSDRLPSLTSLDVQVAREWPLRRGTLELQIDVENLTANRNFRGVDYDLQRDPEGWRLEKRHLQWVRALPSLTLRWSF